MTKSFTSKYQRSHYRLSRSGNGSKCSCSFIALFSEKIAQLCNSDHTWPMAIEEDEEDDSYGDDGDDSKGDEDDKSRNE